METISQNYDYQLGLLHFAHLLIAADGQVHENEEKAFYTIKQQEHISARVYSQFVADISNKTEREVFMNGLDRMNRCTEEEKLCAFVHLYRMAKADDNLDVKEVKLLLYSLAQTKIEFEDVVLTAQMAVAQEQARNQKWLLHHVHEEESGSLMGFLKQGWLSGWLSNRQ